ncbi:XRE family transcriptional regulator [Pseudoalteromonas sp. J010]|uniref:helix-turn-helix domain-containing protein n=1 Tax=Pseudoalteromonas sp. J010 TaxID=998465 RepID=UPI000F64DBB2|nr:helix-turn-helix transcriptional regulator [Pseudoalteromonas sp. J010]RRS10003.1 XRE family transcriptional regulator [Pseudoalteromonas sp. J010]
MNEEKILQVFGLHIKSLRLKLGLSQEELASLCELDRTYISGIERGKRNISLLNILKLADSLQSSASELMNFKSKDNNDKPI